MIVKTPRIRAVPLVAVLLAVAAVISQNGFSTDQRPCSDPVPVKCAQVRYVGEMDGCACFICNVDTKDEQAVCTRNTEDKEQLLKKPRS